MTEDKNQGLAPMFSIAIPVLAVSDVTETITYWKDILGFPESWSWGEPVVHGGVNWHGAFLQFVHNPELAALSKGNSVFIRVRNVDVLYKQHIAKEVKIVYPLENQDYGMAQYTILDINGYYISFASQISDRENSGAKSSDSIRIQERTPTIEEYKALMNSVGWSSDIPDEMLRLHFRTAVFVLVAEDIPTGDIVGCAFLLGDHVGFYYVKDVIVKPAWQGKRIGTQLMQGLMNWLEAHAQDYSTVGLFTGDHLAPFYAQFGFIQASGMYRQIIRRKDEQV